MNRSAAAFALRRGRSRERLLKGLLGTASLSLLFVYTAALVHLLLRGGLKMVSFTSYAYPLSGVEGESAMRWIVAACLFGSVAWGLSSIVRFVLTRVLGSTLSYEAPSRAFVAGAAILGALLMRAHLPRFLVSMPSETASGGGVGPEIFNTIYFAVLSTLVTLPIGVGAATYLARFARSQRFVKALRMALDTLASLPSIVYGLFGFLVFVVEMKAGYSLFAGAFVLALLNLPLVVGVTEESLRAVPRELEDASLALGATQVETVRHVTLPYAWPGVLSALVLSIGRVFAESAPLIMTAGTTVSRSSAYSLSPFRGGETLAVHLWYVNSSGLAPDKVSVSAGTAAVLVALIALTNMLAARLSRFGGAQGSRAPGHRLTKATR
jgi:phosphate transport system permease protein